MFKHIKEKYFTPKDENSVRFKRYMAKKIDGKYLKYVVERTDSGEKIIGKDGCISCKDGMLIVFSSGNTVMKTEIEAARISELLSLDGVIITSFDHEEGREKTVVAHYTYYRK